MVMPALPRAWCFKAYAKRRRRRPTLDFLIPLFAGLLVPASAEGAEQGRTRDQDSALSAEAAAAKAGKQWEAFDTLVRRETAACVERFTGPDDCTTLLLELLERARGYNSLSLDAGPIADHLGRPLVDGDNSEANGKLAGELARAAPAHVLARYAPAQPFLLIGDPSEASFPTEPLAALARAFHWEFLSDYPPIPDMMLGNALAVLLVRAGRPEAAAGVLAGPGLIKRQSQPEAVLGAMSHNFAVVLNTQAVIAELRMGRADRDSLHRAAAILAADPVTSPIAAAVVNLNLARALQEDGDYEGAERAYRRWLPVLGQGHPGYANVLVDRARAVGALGRGDEAMALLDQALAMLGPGQGTDRLRAVLVQADALTAQGKRPQAEAALAAAIKAQTEGADMATPPVSSLANASMPTWLGTMLAKAPATSSRAGTALAHDRLLGEAYRRHAQMLADAGRNDKAATEVSMARKLNGWDLDAQVLEASLKVFAYSRVDIPSGPSSAEWQEKNNRADTLAADARTWLQNVQFVAGSDAAPASIAASSALGLLDLKTNGPVYAYPALQRASRGALARIEAMHGFAEAERNELGRYRDQFRGEMIIDLAAARIQGPRPAATGTKTADALVSDAFVAAQWAEQTLAAAALGRVAARFAAGKGELAVLERQREELSRRAEAAQRTFLGLLGDLDPQATALRDAAGAQRDRLASELADIEQRMVAADPAYADLTRPMALTTVQTQALLGKNEALLLLVPAPDATYVIAISREGIAWNRSEKLAEAALGQIVDRLRTQISGETSRSTSLGGGVVRSTSFDRKLAYSLYQELIQPIEATLAGKSTVMTVTAGALGKLPLVLLVTAAPTGTDGDPAAEAATPWLIDRYALTTLPAVSSLRALRCLLVPARERHAGCGPVGRRTTPERASTGGTLLAGFGAPALRGSADAENRAPTYAAAFNGSLADTAFLRKLPSLPGSLAELTAIAGQFPTGRTLVVTGGQATETRIKQSAELVEARYVIFSTHGLLSSESGLRGEPGLVFTPPAEADKSDLDDGLLTASEAAALRLSAELVILSACNTAASDGSAGGEGLSGLARGFFFAGARSLMVSHWPVSDAATSTLIMDVFQRIQAHESAPTALQQAIKAVRANPRWASPAFWAPFVLVGAGS